MENSKFIWDVAISLCKEDIEFAKKLVKAINPTLEVFFYEYQQKELISKSGPEAFSRIFKEQSRVVVILSRKEWSNTYYTEIERNAIIARTAVENEGYHFLIVIPMVQNEIPPWYPPTNIYANPFNFSVKELAHFIEFKVAEEGGILKLMTVEDQYRNILFRIEEKKTIISIQKSKDAIIKGHAEIELLKECFNIKSDFIRSNTFEEIIWKAFSEHVNQAEFGYGNFLLKCEIILPDYHQIRTTQDIKVEMKLLQNQIEIFDEELRVFYYTPQIKGWSKQKHYNNETISSSETGLLFRIKDVQNEFIYYDLFNPLNTEIYVDKWFQKLISYGTKALQRHF